LFHNAEYHVFTVELLKAGSDQNTVAIAVIEVFSTLVVFVTEQRRHMESK